MEASRTNRVVSDVHQKHVSTATAAAAVKQSGVAAAAAAAATSIADTN